MQQNNLTIKTLIIADNEIYVCKIKKKMFLPSYNILKTGMGLYKED